jgi:hypothetical protein
MINCSFFYETLQLIHCLYEIIQCCLIGKTQTKRSLKPNCSSKSEIFVFKLTIVLLNLSSKHFDPKKLHRLIYFDCKPAMVVEYPNFISSVAAKGKALP